MKFTILIGALALAATSFTTISHASAVFGNSDNGGFKGPRVERSNINRGFFKKNSKFPDFKFEMKHSRSKGKKNNKDSNNVSVPGPTTGGNGAVHNKPTPPQTPTDAGNGNQHNNNNSGGNNTNPPQLNSYDIKGFDPFSGLYGPGT